jgi:hypothetical protein
MVVGDFISVRPSTSTKSASARAPTSRDSSTKSISRMISPITDSAAPTIESVRHIT